MVLLQVSDNNFWYDHGVAVVSATVTFLAFLLTFITLIINSRKEKKEAEEKSQKTLSVLDFIFENNDNDLKSFLDQIKYIRENLPKEPPLPKNIYQHSTIEEWKEAWEENKYFRFHIDYRGMKIPIPGMSPDIKTKFENNYIVLETYRFLKVNKFTSKLNSYQDEIKINLKNQHLNITSSSLEKISDKIHGLKESIAIFESFKVTELVGVSINEVVGKTEEEISEIVDKNVLDYINEEHEKLLKLEKILKKVVKPLNGKD